MAQYVRHTLGVVRSLFLQVAPPEGANVATLQNDLGDLRLFAGTGAGARGIAIGAASGYVGLGGQLAPTCALDVSGDARVTGSLSTSNLNFRGLLLQNGLPYIGSQWTSAYGAVVYASNVGIGGLGVPTRALDVSGDARVTGTLTSSNLNFSGLLLQNGLPYIGSQWTTTNNGFLSYGSNVDVSGGLRVHGGPSVIGGVAVDPSGAALRVAGDVAVDGCVRAAKFVDASGNAYLQRADLGWFDYGGTVWSTDVSGDAMLSPGASGSVTCRYSLIGRLVLAEIALVLGASASLGPSGRAWRWSLPVAPSSAFASGAVVGSALVQVHGVTNYTGVVRIAVDGQSAEALIGVSPALGLGPDASGPGGWPSGSSVRLLVSYEASAVAVSLPSSSLPIPPLLQDLCGNIMLNGQQQFLPAAMLQYRPYLPTWSGGAVGDGALVGNWYQLGTIVTAQVSLSLGSTTALSSADPWTFSLPLAASSTAAASVCGTAWLSGPSTFSAAVLLQAGASVVTLAYGSVTVGRTVPFAWQGGQSQTLTFVVTYATSSAPLPLPSAAVALRQNMAGAIGVGGSPGDELPLGALQAFGPVSAPSLSAQSLLGGCLTDSSALSSSTVAASALALSNVSVVAAQALPRAGGAVTGSLSVAQTLHCSDVLDVSGDVHVSGAITCPGVNAPFTLNGGGTVSWSGTHLSWSMKASAASATTNGFIDIGPSPTSGTIVHYTGETVTTLACTAQGIPLPALSALYYIVIPGQASAFVQSQLVCVTFPAPAGVSSNWILLAVYNELIGTLVVPPDSGMVVVTDGDVMVLPDSFSIKWCASGAHIPPGCSYSCASGQVEGTPSLRGDLDVCGNVHVAGSIVQKGIPLVGSQWTSVNGVITFGSNVGIGTSVCPVYALDVSGSLRTSGFVGGCITDSLTTSSSTCAASAAGLSNVNAVATAALPKAGGTVAGNLTVTGQFSASNVAVLGSIQTINAYETHSSNVVINNLGTGPALVVTQTLGAQPVAQFTAGANVALYISSTGYVGVGKASAACALDVSGDVNVSGGINTNGVAIGTRITGTWLNPTFSSGGNQNLFSLSISAGTWIVTGSVYLFTGSTGRFITYINDGGNLTQDEVYSSLTGLSITCQSTVVLYTASTKTIYFTGYSTCGGTNAWSNTGKGFYAVKIC